MSPTPPGDGQAPLAAHIQRASNGDPESLSHVIDVLYEELHAIARWRRAQWHGNDTLTTTVLVNEAYLRLHRQPDAHWQNRAHFLAIASRAMRQVLIDYSRKRSRQKRGGEWDRVTFERVDQRFSELSAGPELRAEALIHLDACLNRLETESPRHCRIVECRFFGGMTIQETAIALGVSETTVKRGWRTARAWLHKEMTDR